MMFHIEAPFASGVDISNDLFELYRLKPVVFVRVDSASW